MIIKVQFNTEQSNRGFVVDRFSAIENDEEIGYLEVEYIPVANYKKYIKSIFHFADLFGGWVLNLEDDDIPEAAYERAARYLGWGHELTKEEIIKRTVRHHSKALKELKRYHVNNPHPGYIRVKEEHKRKGIATKLIFAAAREYQKMGLNFRSSSLRSKDADAFWKNMESKRLAVYVKKTDWYEFRG